MVYSPRESRRGPLKAAGKRTLTPRSAPANPLLTKDDVGRAKPTTYDIPGKGFSFGKPNCTEADGAREAIACWTDHVPSDDPRGKPGTYFPLLNKMTVGDKEKQRILADAAIKARPTGMPAQRDVIPSDSMPGFAYGRKVRPSTPMGEIINNRTGVAAEQAMLQHYEELQREKEDAANMVYKIYSTKASRGQSSAASKAQAPTSPTEPPPENAFKLNRFKNASPKVDLSGGPPAASQVHM